MNDDELEITWEEAIVTYFKAMSRHWTRVK